MRASKRFGLLLCLTVVAAGGCSQLFAPFSPPYGTLSVSCGTADTCPHDYVCCPGDKICRVLCDPPDLSAPPDLTAPIDAGVPSDANAPPDQTLGMDQAIYQAVDQAMDQALVGDQASPTDQALPPDQTLAPDGALPLDGLVQADMTEVSEVDPDLGPPQGDLGDELADEAMELD